MVFTIYRKRKSGKKIGNVGWTVNGKPIWFARPKKLPK